MRARFILEDPGVRSLRFAAEAYDATILAALAATLAGDDGGASIDRMLPAASSGGIPCASYGECLDVLRTQDDIDFRGVSGSLDLDENGERHRSRLRRLRLSRPRTRSSSPNRPSEGVSGLL